MNNPIPLSLYIHIPWCVRKCPYCDFNSHQSQQNLPEQEYINCLIEDLSQELELIQGRKIDSIFFGGGTPSLFSTQSLNSLLNNIRNTVELKKNCEITLEANPGAIDASKFSGFLAAGINRLSIGVQSFRNKQLKLLGRIHNSDEAINAYQLARQEGFENINLDLMFGLPEQNKQLALDDLQQAIDLNPDHISWYQLTLEPNTVFFSKPPPLPNDILLEDIEFAGKDLLKQNAYQQYEISAYSKSDKQCQHNLNYWQFGDYLGIGAGAHGKISTVLNASINDINNDKIYDKRYERKIIRRQKTRLPDDYLNHNKNYLAKEEIVSDDELPLEFMMNALRLKKGVSSDLYNTRTFLEFDTIRATVKLAQQQGLMISQADKLCTTEHGFHFLNQVLSMFDDN